MRRPLLAVLLLAALAAPGIAAETDPIDIVRNPGTYNGRFLTVRGTMMNVRPATAGGVALPPATVFDLVAGPAILAVLSTVPPSCPMGSTVTVDGRFMQMTQIRQQFFANVIEATWVTCH